ncbi:hypothetical protein PT2222_180199 [Paraburkholderia tropica]
MLKLRHLTLEIKAIEIGQPASNFLILSH